MAPARWISSGDQEDTDRRERQPRLLHRRSFNLHPRGHTMVKEGVIPALVENAAKRPACRSDRWRLPTRPGVDLAWKILKATEADSAEGSVDPAIRRCSKRWWSSSSGSDARRQGYYDYPASGPKSLWPGLADIAGKRVDPDSISVQDLTDGSCPRLRPKPRAACSTGRRRLGGRCRIDPRLPLRALQRRHDLVHRGHGAQGLRGARQRTRGELRPSTSTRPRSWSRWPRGETFYGVYGKSQKAA